VPEGCLIGVPRKMSYGATSAPYESGRRSR
jgi:hypothetical protein